jgi:hypothetical protein
LDLPFLFVQHVRAAGFALENIANGYLLEHGLLPLLLVVGTHLLFGGGGVSGRFLLGTFFLFLGVLRTGISSIFFLFVVLILFSVE